MGRAGTGPRTGVDSIRARIVATGIVIAAVAASLAIGNAPAPSGATDRTQDRDQPGKRIHITLRDPETGEVAFSTRPNRTGSLVEQHRSFDAREPDGPVAGNYSAWPEPLRVLAPMLRPLPDGSTLDLEDVTLGDADGNRTLVPAEATFPLSGTLPRDRARSLLGFVAEGSTKMYLGSIPVTIRGVDPSGVRYVIQASAVPERTPVPGSQGLFVEARTDGDRIRFSLEAPQGAFQVEGRCNALGTTLEGGFYEVVAPQGDDLVLRRFDSGLERALDDRTYDATLTTTR